MATEYSLPGTEGETAMIGAFMDVTRSPKLDSTSLLITNYILTRSDVFRKLCELREEGWHNPQGNKHFKKQRKLIDNASRKKQFILYKLMQCIGDELQNVTEVLCLPEPEAQILDICMAPGGYSASALKYSSRAHVSGLTLPCSLGGHPLLIPFGRKDPRVNVRFVDITMLATEYGVTNIPADHPEASLFSHERPWGAELFDLVFCDGMVLRSHAPHMASYRGRIEATRLACSQLILAMQRIRIGGTFVMLLHKVEKWNNVKLLVLFDQISQIELFKPTKCHRTRSSFYLVAKNVQPHHPKAVAAIVEWKESWKEATFPPSVEGEDQNQTASVEKQVQIPELENILEKHGERLVKLGEPVWQIQKSALEIAPWRKHGDTETGRARTTPAESWGSGASADPAQLSSTMGDL